MRPHRGGADATARLNPSIRAPWETSYTPEMIERVNDLYEIDFHTFGYEMETP